MGIASQSCAEMTCGQLMDEFVSSKTIEHNWEDRRLEREKWVDRWLNGMTSYGIKGVAIATLNEIEAKPELRYNKDFFPMALLQVTKAELLYWDKERYNNLIMLINNKNVMMLFDAPLPNHRSPAALLGTSFDRGISLTLKKHIYDMVIDKDDLGSYYEGLTGSDYIDFINCWKHQ